MSNATIKYMAIFPRRQSVVVPVYSVRFPPDDEEAGNEADEDVPAPKRVQYTTPEEQVVDLKKDLRLLIKVAQRVPVSTENGFLMRALACRLAEKHRP